MGAVQKHAALLATLLLSAPHLSTAVSYRKMVMGNSAHAVGDNSVQSGAYSYEDGALYMSDFIKQGDTEGLRAAAAVDPSLFLGYTSYAGYITVNQTTNANTFLWYFPSINNGPSAPLIVWLQGGPGASSIFALFTEIGPFTTNGTALYENPYSWCLNYSCLFIDNPPGTGLSFVDPDGYCSEWTCYGNYLDSALRQLATGFPELQSVPVYIIGESYGGKYAPAMAYTLWKNNGAGVKPFINIGGLGVGDGWTDPIHQVAPYADEMYQFSLLSDAQHAEALATYVNPALAAISSGDFLQGFDIWDKFLNGDVWPYASYYYNVTGVTDYYNIMRDAEPASFGNWETFVTQPAILNAIHAGNHSENSGTTVEMALLSDFMYSLAPQMTEMLDAGIRVLVYNGQLDVIIGAPLTENYLWNLQWSGAPAYHNATKDIWHVDGLVAGYVRQTNGAKGLTQAVVRGCGHILPADNPARALDLVTRFIESIPYN